MTVLVLVGAFALGFISATSVAIALAGRRKVTDAHQPQPGVFNSRAAGPVYISAADACEISKRGARLLGRRRLKRDLHRHFHHNWSWEHMKVALAKAHQQDFRYLPGPVVGIVVSSDGTVIADEGSLVHEAKDRHVPYQRADMSKARASVTGFNMGTGKSFGEPV